MASAFSPLVAKRVLQDSRNDRDVGRRIVDDQNKFLVLNSHVGRCPFEALRIV
jgi:hypothetical protein